MLTLWISFILLALVRNVLSGYDPTVCSLIEESYGLIPPPLPINFGLKAEHVDHTENYSIYEEMYFDYTNSRAKYKYLLDSLEYNYLFDYDTQQIVEWIKVHPGTTMKRDPLSHSCEAVNMEASPYSYIFGYKDWIYEHPKMFNSFQVLRYGGQYLYAANGTGKLYDRGLQVNKFIGCLYDPFINGTMFNDYYFADTAIVQPSGGTPSSVVTGSDQKPLSVPVKLHAVGRYYDGNKGIPINKTISISWFKGEPQFETGIFQIPPWIHCENYRGRKTITKFPTAFSTRVIITSFLIDTLGQLQEEASSESYEEIYYDSDKKLARRDFTPNQHIDGEIYGKFGSYTPVSTIYDFNEGLRYTINKPSGRCYITPIMENEYFDTEEELIYRKLATPEEIFLLQMDDMQYKGKAFARDIMCDVWNGKHYHEKYAATFVKETYYATDGWHEIADGMVEYGVPVKNVLIKKELDGEVSEGISTYDFLKFKGRPPKVDSFNIKNCVELIDHKRFAIELTLNSDNSDLVFTYKFLFLEAAQLYIANKTEVNTPLRVQRLHLRHQSISGTRVFLIFSLLDKANLKDFPGVIGQKGKDLQEAILLLQKLVDAGNFSVQFKHPKTNEIIVVQAQKRSLYSLTASGYLTPAPLKPATLRERNDEESAIISKKTTYEEHEGMTSGHLALLAFAMLFIGVGVGIAIMYLYLRIYSERHVEDKIDMTTTAGTSGEG